jgi:bacillithiol biosynthesis deacetylase BshB1
MTTSALQPCDVLAIGPHPDDVEIAAAGTLILLGNHGLRRTIVDLTRGEMGSRGTADERAAEAAAAANLLGLQQRANLGLPDTGLVDDEPTARQIVAVLRSSRPQLLLAPHARDVHPDHGAAAAVISRACFLAGLRNYAPELGSPHRPRLVLRYPGNQPIEASLVVDIAAVEAQKAAVVRSYASQLQPPTRSHLVLGLDVLERAQVRDRYHGAIIGVSAGEAFWHDGPLPIRNMSQWLGSALT